MRIFEDYARYFLLHKVGPKTKLEGKVGLFSEAKTQIIVLSLRLKSNIEG